MRRNINFIAIDFETATGKRNSVCEAGICVVREGRVVETKSWLIRPENNQYSYWNIRVHGIQPEHTENAPAFPTIWKEIEEYIADCPVLVAHNAAFDMGCIRHSFELYGMDKPQIAYYCTLRAARRIYDFDCNSLGHLCEQLEIPQGSHHRAGDDAEMCARLFLKEIEDAGGLELDEFNYCSGIL